MRPPCIVRRLLRHLLFAMVHIPLDLDGALSTALEPREDSGVPRPAAI